MQSKKTGRRDSRRPFSCAYDTTSPYDKKTEKIMQSHAYAYNTQIYRWTSQTRFSFILISTQLGPIFLQSNDTTIYDARGETSSQGFSASSEAQFPLCKRKTAPKQHIGNKFRNKIMTAVDTNLQFRNRMNTNFFIHVHMSLPKFEVYINSPPAHTTSTCNPAKDRFSLSVLNLILLPWTNMAPRILLLSIVS